MQRKRHGASHLEHLSERSFTHLTLHSDSPRAYGPPFVREVGFDYQALPTKWWGHTTSEERCSGSRCAPPSCMHLLHRHMVLAPKHAMLVHCVALPTEPDSTTD
jgi:hypothetical protein